MSYAASAYKSVVTTVVHFAITRNPFMNWVVQQLRESMPFGLQPKYLFRDNEGAADPPKPTLRISPWSGTERPVAAGRRTPDPDFFHLAHGPMDDAERFLGHRTIRTVENKCNEILLL